MTYNLKIKQNKLNIFEPMMAMSFNQQYQSWILYFCTLFFGLLALPSQVEAHWSKEKIQEFIMKEFAVPLEKDVRLYRWGSAEHELKRTEDVLGKGVIPFDLTTVNMGYGMAGRGLYLAESLSESSVYVTHLKDKNHPPALVEVIVRAGSLFLDFRSRKNLQKLKSVGISVADAVESDPPALVRFGAVDGRNPGSYGRSLYVAKNPNDLVIREFSPYGISIFDHLENESRILDVSLNPLAVDFYYSKVKGQYADFAYALDRDTQVMKLYEVKSDFFSASLNSKEPVYGVRMNGKCALFVPSNSGTELALVSEKVNLDDCRKYFPTEISRDLKGICAEVLQDDPRVVLRYISEQKCQPLFCRARSIYKPKTGESLSGYSLSLASRPYLNYPSDPASGFSSFSSCRASMNEALRNRTGLVCLPQTNGVFHLVSLQSIVPSLPEFYAETLEECLGWTSFLNRDLKILCEKHENHYELVSYRDPYQHRRVGSMHFDSLGECQAALPGLSSSIYDQENELERNRVAKVQSLSALSPDHLIHFVKQEYPYLKTLLEGSGQQWDSSTLEDHISAVLKLSQEIDSLYDIGGWSTQDEKYKNLKGLMNVLLLMHDMGKGVGRRAFQIQLNEPIASHFFRKWGYSPFEVKLGSELVSDDVIGLMVQKKISVTEAINSIKRKANRSQVPSYLFFLLNMHYYTADAGSYPSLRQDVFVDLGNGMIVPQFCIDHTKEFEEALK
jgi:hypothetical protein